jgi:rhamnose transport system permease protein
VSTVEARRTLALRGFRIVALPRVGGGILVFALILLVVFSIAEPKFAAPENLGVIVSNSSLLLVVAAAQTVVLLTRNLDVSVGAIMGLTGYVSADYAAHHPNTGLDLIVVALAIGGVLGGINGLIVAYGEVSSLIATLGTMSLYRGFTYIYAGGQEITSYRLPPQLLGAVNYRIGGVPLLLVVCVLVVLTVALFLRLFPLGRRIYAIGSSPVASIFCGLRIERVTLVAFTLCGMMCGFAGLLYAARVGTVTVVLASGWEMTSLAAAVLGGVSIAGGSGSVIGAALGAIVLSAIDNGLIMLNFTEFWRMFVQGCAIIAAVAADVVVRRRMQATARAERLNRRVA